MSDRPHDIQERTFVFACEVIRLCDASDDQRFTTRHVLRELLKAGTSVGANMEEASAGQSKPDFIAKLSISLKEARESRYWLRVFSTTRPRAAAGAAPLLQESGELVRILTTILKNARNNPYRGSA